MEKIISLLNMSECYIPPVAALQNDKILCIHKVPVVFLFDNLKSMNYLEGKVYVRENRGRAEKGINA